MLAPTIAACPIPAAADKQQFPNPRTEPSARHLTQLRSDLLQIAAADIRVAGCMTPFAVSCAGMVLVIERRLNATSALEAA